MENSIERLRNMTSLYLLCGGRILLLYRQGSRVVNQVWIGSAGGHFEKDELNDPRACVLRELAEELSLPESRLRNLALRYITLRRTAGEIRQNYYFFADLPDGLEMELHSSEGILKWFPLEEISGLEMPFTARYVMEHYLREGRFSRALYGGIADSHGVAFTELPAD